MSYIDKTIKEVSIPYQLSQSQKGKYFIGQTPILSGSDGHALTALVNPVTSKINIYVNAITITNNSSLNSSAEFYLKSNLENGLISDSISCTNLTIVPESIPQGEIQYLNSTTKPPNSGVSIFSRIVSPYSTLVVDGGQIIIPPGQSLTVYLGGFLPIAYDSTIVAFGWWEEIACKYRDCYYC